MRIARQSPGRAGPVALPRGSDPGGIGLFFYFGSSTQPVVPPTVQETVR